jgi:hypothetical protein
MFLAQGTFVLYAGSVPITFVALAGLQLRLCRHTAGEREASQSALLAINEWGSEEHEKYGSRQSKDFNCAQRPIPSERSR